MIMGTSNVNFPWHALSIQEVLSKLETEPSAGLSETEAAARLQRYGPNALREHPRPTFWHRLLAQFQSFVIYILIGLLILFLLLLLQGKLDLQNWDPRKLDPRKKRTSIQPSAVSFQQPAISNNSSAITHSVLGFVGAGFKPAPTADQEQNL